ncbi:hypothetical protein NPIL_24621 [Nephila pilipes]|uniref:Uncharacterized protein n=1 Tax=Nephila pilipes TaxID=299642 RepID=A0A8X6R078_NEPPI|nr:hypothetical protein NPIL_24621 [Nephila pilipes]
MPTPTVGKWGRHPLESRRLATKPEARVLGGTAGSSSLASASKHLRRPDVLISFPNYCFLREEAAFFVGSRREMEQLAMRGGRQLIAIRSTMSLET